MLGHLRDFLAFLREAWSVINMFMKLQRCFKDERWSTRYVVDHVHGIMVDILWDMLGKDGSEKKQLIG